jgi:hypothetical protein
MYCHIAMSATDDIRRLLTNLFVPNAVRNFKNGIHAFSKRRLPFSLRGVD